MTSSRPYLLRALNEWIVDNGMTPQILVDATHENLQIPDAVRNSEKVVLNIAPAAVRDLEIDDEYVSFIARFSGVSHGVLVPVQAVEAVYARENGKGMMFPDLDDDPDPTPDPSGDDARDDSGRPSGKGKRKRPNLKVIK